MLGRNRQKLILSSKYVWNKYKKPLILYTKNMKIFENYSGRKHQIIYGLSKVDVG